MSVPRKSPVWKKAQEMVTEAIGWLVANYPFIASVLLGLRVRYRDVPNFVAGVSQDHRELLVSTCFLSCGEDPRVVLAHEALHILNGSFLRQGNRDPVLWNLATDIEINHILKEMGFEVRHGLQDERFKEMCAEEIYEELLKLQDQAARELLWELAERERELQEALEAEGGGGYRDNTNRVRELVGVINELKKELAKRFGIPVDEHTILSNHPHVSDSMKDLVKRHILESIIVATQVAKITGAKNIPGRLQRIIDRLLEPKVSWKDLFTETIHHYRENYSYRKLHPSYLLLGDIAYPTLCEGRGMVVVIVDTSGSIDEETLRKFLTEVKGIVEEFKTIYIACDCEVQAVVEDGNIEEIVRATKGGGGTEFTPAFEWIAENVFEPCSVVLMTDGHNWDEEIQVPGVVEQIVVLTTDREPAGLLANRVIRLEDA